MSVSSSKGTDNETHRNKKNLDICRDQVKKKFHLNHFEFVLILSLFSKINLVQIKLIISK